MHLPTFLQEAIEKQITSLKLSELQKCSEGISHRYRNGVEHFLQTPGDRLAYLAARFPATYTACAEVLLEVQKRMPGVRIETLLDVGAGPGTGMWAAQEMFSTLKSATLVERDRGLIEIGKALAKGARCETKWQVVDLEKEWTPEPHDLVLVSYAIGELPEKVGLSLIPRLWEAARGLLVFIEPGTPKGFMRIRKIREALIALKAPLIAPCPHAESCPMKEGDWCHFSGRLERSSFHRKIKGGTLGHEDEKFSYIVAGKSPALPIQGRILRHPLKRSGHVTLSLCTDQGLTTRTVTRKEKESYSRARKAEWGENI
jgi:ribosomal protein RSM22 (predicted rRNA methylase)